MRGLLLCIATLGAVIGPPATAANAPFCGDEGAWIQVLGSSDAELDTDRAAAGYLVWVDGQARLLVGAGSGSAYNFRRAGARFADLDAIALPNVTAPQTADLASFVAGSATAGRSRPLPVFGPDGNDAYPGTQTLLERLIGAGGAYPDLAAYLTFRNDGGYKLSSRDVQASGRRRWARFGTSNLRLAAIPVHHGNVPSLAWRVDIDDQSMVFAGSFNNTKNVVTEFARGADLLVVHHAIAETTRGELRDWFVTPSQIGRIAKESGVRILLLGHRTARTLGRESQSREFIEAQFGGALIFANELECWGL